MTITFDRADARRIIHDLLGRPSAPGYRSHMINVGTDWLLDWLTEDYFASGLDDNESCFKYVQGYYGSGKTQFIQSLAARAWRHGIVTAVIDIGQTCPFNSQLAIYQAVMRHLRPPPERGREVTEDKGLEVLVDDWVRRRLAERGIEIGRSVPPDVEEDLLQRFNTPLAGFRDTQTASAVRLLCQRRIALACGATEAPMDSALVAWLRGDPVSDPALKQHGIQQAATEQNAFNRLKTVLSFLRRNLGCRGFLIAFDEGYRTASFRRGSTGQNKSVENLLTMCNEGSDGDFASVMFVYAATPDFRNEVIQAYPALNDRIGQQKVTRSRPETRLRGFIDLDALDTDAIVREIGAMLLDLFEAAYDLRFDRALQAGNIERLLSAEKQQFGIGSEIRRFFVYHCCALLERQRHHGERLFEPHELTDLLTEQSAPDSEAA